MHLWGLGAVAAASIQIYDRLRLQRQSRKTLLGLSAARRGLRYTPARASVLEDAVQLASQIRGQAARVHPFTELGGLQQHSTALLHVLYALQERHAPHWPA